MIKYLLTEVSPSVYEAPEEFEGSRTDMLINLQPLKSRAVPEHSAVMHHHLQSTFIKLL